jgi:C-methyltransferase
MNEQLKGLFTQHWLYLALKAACHINLFDELAQKAISEDELAEILGTDRKATHHLISALKYHGFIKENSGFLSLTELSEPLTEAHTHSLKYACLLWGGEHMDAWQHIDSTIKTGKPVFNTLYGKPFFDFLHHNESRSEEYHRAMYEYARDDYAGIDKSLCLDDSNIILDVGGANGALSYALSLAFPEKEFIIFDIQDRRSEGANGIQFIQGDFFSHLPMVADTILLSRVLHDWPNDKAQVILKNCMDALPDGGRLFVIENDLSKITDGAHLLSLNMMALCNSYERTMPEYLELLTSVGLTCVNQTNHNHLLIIESKKP